jgi:hypothetical protein
MKGFLLADDVLLRDVQYPVFALDLEGIHGRGFLLVPYLAQLGRGD